MYLHGRGVRGRMLAQRNIAAVAVSINIPNRRGMRTETNSG